MLPLLALAFACLLLAAYHAYGRWIERQLAPDDARATPACERADGTDFVPTPRFYLFAQHLSAIAAAGPIAGPILAARDFGWLPCLVWILLGVVLIGAVHDFSSLFASVRHGAGSIAEIARASLGGGAGRALMAFVFIALVYVIVAFADITAGSFAAGTEELAALDVAFHPGGAVALASALYLALSIAMGLVQRFLKPPLWLASAIFVPLVFAAVWLGTQHSALLLYPQRTWGLVILVYCVLAAVAPVWLLLQPRGYLGGFVLFTALTAGLAGVLFGGYEIQQPAFKGFTVAEAARHALPVPVRDDRLRRLLGLPRPGVLGHDLEAGRARVAHALRRLRRDAGRGAARLPRAGDPDDRARRRHRRALAGRDLRQRPRAASSTS